MSTPEAFVDSEDQDQTVQNMQSDLGSTLLLSTSEAVVDSEDRDQTVQNMQSDLRSTLSIALLYERFVSRFCISKEQPLKTCNLLIS